jgi:hypothetical protein
MKLKDLKQNIKVLLEEGKIKKGFKLIKKVLNRESNNYSKFNSLRAQFNLIQDKNMSNSINLDTYDAELEKIGKLLWTFTESLNEADLETVHEFVHHEISNKILVLTTKTQIKSVKFFFKQLSFVNVHIKPMGAFSSIMLDKYDLIIFDNKDLKPCYKKSDLTDKVASDERKYIMPTEERYAIKDRIDKMEKVIKETTRFIIHYGEHLFWINSNRERIQAANSKFSLYARTREVIEFINTYRV